MPCVISLKHNRWHHNVGVISYSSNMICQSKLQLVLLVSTPFSLSLCMRSKNLQYMPLQLPDMDMGLKTLTHKECIGRQDVGLIARIQRTWPCTLYRYKSSNVIFLNETLTAAMISISDPSPMSKNLDTISIISETDITAF